MPKYEIPVNVGNSKRLIVTVTASDPTEADQDALIEAKRLGYDNVSLFLEPERSHPFGMQPKMTPSQFWSEQDKLESAFKAGRISLSELMARTTILGWQWHHNNRECLPARPLEEKYNWGVYVRYSDGTSSAQHAHDYPHNYTEAEAKEREATDQRNYTARPLKSDQTWGIFITEDADPMCSRSRDYPDSYSEDVARKIATTRSYYVAKPL
jgi:hypothetical protein